MSGQVTNRASSEPIPGAQVIASYPPGVPVVTTDARGRYVATGLPPPGSNGFVWATADNYEADVQYHRAEVQNFRLYPIDRIPAGDSRIVTVGPEDSLGTTDALGPGWGADVVCRIVRLSMTTDGVLTVEALPTIAGRPHPVLEVLLLDSAGTHILQQSLTNPASLQVTAGTEVMAIVAIPATETTKQSFRLTTAWVGDGHTGGGER
jgi:hypothetical protein